MSNIQEKLSLGRGGIFLVSQEFKCVPDPALNVVQKVHLHGVAVLGLVAMSLCIYVVVIAG